MLIQIRKRKMDKKNSYTLQALVATVVLNTVLLLTLYSLYGSSLPEGAELIFFSIGIALTLVLCVVLLLVGRRLIDTETADPAPPPVLEAEEPASRPVTRPITQPVQPVAPPPAPPSDAAAVQMLAVLQREGRLIDFLQEDLTPYADDQIGAAVRPIHEGTRKALQEHVTLEPVYSESEGSRVTVEPGFDPHAVRLTGNVNGEPPFTGTLHHRGWRIASIDLPGGDDEMIVAAAEIEVG